MKLEKKEYTLEMQIYEYERMKEGIGHQYVLAVMSGNVHAQKVAFREYVLIDNIIENLYKREMRKYDKEKRL